MTDIEKEIKRKKEYSDSVKKYLSSGYVAQQQNSVYQQILSEQYQGRHKK